jgi:hypothetical protein
VRTGATSEAADEVRVLSERAKYEGHAAIFAISGSGNVEGDLGETDNRADVL